MAAIDQRRQERSRTRTTGVCPRRPQVRARDAVIENPASSSKTMNAPIAAADIVSINKAFELLNFSGASVTRKYQQANAGYFPDSVGEVEGPTGRMIQAFRVGELQDFGTRLHTEPLKAINPRWSSLLHSPEGPIFVLLLLRVDSAA